MCFLISLSEYIKNPCGSLSIPYWKNKDISVPENIKIVHQDDYDESLFMNYNDTPYFRLYHTLSDVCNISIDGYSIKTAEKNDISKIVDIINNSYTDLSVTYNQMKSYTETSAYDSDLWILVCNEKTSEIVGCGIADFDHKAKEGILEWIQVLPHCRGKKIGQLIVTELLYRMIGKATFATVSGKVNDITRPEVLYRKCGFTGSDVWHILFAK